MRIVFVHQNFPAQFGHVARYLAIKHDHDCFFVSERPPTPQKHLRMIQYRVQGRATAKNHYCSRPFETAVWHAHAVHEALAKQESLAPDLIVGHSGFGSTLFLKNLYRCPLINYFEYFYHQRNSDLDFRPDFPAKPVDALKGQVRNAMILLDLNACDRGYSPTHWQHSRLPPEYRDKVEVLFDGIDMTVWSPGAVPDRRIGDWEVPPGVKLVTYATRGMEAMRGFDIFMRVARRLSRERSDLMFAIAGTERVCYGNDLAHTGGVSLKEYMLSQGDYDLSRFKFLGLLPPVELAKLFRLSDLHFYLTVPFILSWSLMNALACGATVLASDTSPVREVIQHGHNGLLVSFFDEDGFVQEARKVLDDPGRFRPLGKEGRRLVNERYSYDVCLPRIGQFFEAVAARKNAGAGA